EKQAEGNNNPECSEPGTMDLKFPSSRKYISISVPSKSQAMSPHIKSVDDVVVLGMNLSKFSKPAQFFICVSGVFMFYLIYGYLQELIFSVEGFKPFGWYLTLVQFGFYSIFGLIELQLIQDKRRRYVFFQAFYPLSIKLEAFDIYGKFNFCFLKVSTSVEQDKYEILRVLTVHSCCLYFVGKRYNIVDVSAALCMSLGLIWFTLADSTVAPNFNLTGVILISLALCADAVIGNVQEKAMKLHNGSNSEMVNTTFTILKEHLIKVCSFMSFCNTSGFVLHFPNQLFSLLQHPVQTYGYAFLFSLTGYFGISFVLALIKIFGALLAVT
ncbi:S35B3 protein, partial [Buphagus erythrorhynchus]|nr:S35B3 protein [Buphagus erythrorhynchus]